MDILRKAKAVTSERARFFLVKDRDGLKEALKWAKRTIESYEKAISNPKHYAFTQPYRDSFEDSIQSLKTIVALVEQGQIDETTTWEVRSQKHDSPSQ